MKRFAVIPLVALSFCVVHTVCLAQHSAATQGTSPQSPVLTAPPQQQPVNVEMVEKSQLVQQVSTLGSDEMIGRIDWENKIVYAVGDGVPPKDAINPAQARARSKRAAIDEAYARLLETVQEVQVDATSMTRNFVSENRIVQTKVDGLIKNAEIQELKQESDGSYQVMMKMPMTGAKGLSSAILPVELANVRKVTVVAHVKQETVAAIASTHPEAVQKPAVIDMRAAQPEQASKPNDGSPNPTGELPSTGASPPAPATTEKYTSLIVDAKGLGAKPALYPVVQTESGEVIYNIAVADPNSTIEDGLCTYKKSVEEAKKMPKTGERPLIVKAARVGGNSGVDIIVSDQDGKKISEANKVNPFLKSANVNVVID